MNQDEKQKAIDKHLKANTTLTSDDVKKICKYYSQQDKILRRYLIFEIGINTGMRTCEISELTFDDVQNQKITVFTKRSARTILLSNDICKLINQFCNQECIVAGFIFKSTVHLTESVGRQALINDSILLGKETGVDRPSEKFRRCRLHNYRVFYTVLAVDATGKESARDTLGHKSDVMTNHYYRLSPEKQLENLSIISREVKKLKKKT